MSQSQLHRRICTIPHLTGPGGTTTFQKKLAAGLTARGYEVVYSLADVPYSAVLIVGGIYDLWGIWQARRRGVRIVQRLDGMNWIHRKQKTGIRHYLRSEYGNLILASIRSRLASHIVYQSQFARQWWERKNGTLGVNANVIYNGVDLAQYSPQGPEIPPINCYRLLLVEGALGGGYEIGLETAVQIVQALNHHQGFLKRPVELIVAGQVSPQLQASWQKQAGIPIQFSGFVPRNQIPALDRSAHLLYSADLNAACPNSVIEALACGLPVAAFDTGALPELVQGEAGRVVPYGGDVWRLDPPDVLALVEACREILQNQDRFRAGARQRAEEAFNLDDMVERYLQVLVD